ncbi:MAG TPA: shikimate dehydrogenase [Gammaproteobacteria bacterium]
MAASLDSYVVMGNPIAHSKSPQIHALFAQQTGQEMHYGTLLVAQDSFARAVSDFVASGGKGFNITVPFKQEAWALADARSERAEFAGAVNTIVVRDNGTLYGDNTDGVGMVRDIVVNHGCAIQGKRVLVLGAGGAVRGVLGPLLAEIPASVTVANRTVARAVELAELFKRQGTISACGFDELAGEQFDLVINGTSASLKGELPPLPEDMLAKDAWCYDMMYGAEPTPFLRWAQLHGAAHSLDGLGMLVEQAAEAFYLWRGVRPQTLPVIKALRDTLLAK